MIAGANNSGKSALLSGLDVLAANPQSNSRGLAYESSDSATELSAVFDLAEEEAVRLLSESGRSGWSFRAFRQVVFRFAIKAGRDDLELVEVLGSRGDGEFFPFIAYEDREHSTGKIKWSNWRKADPLRDKVELINSFGEIAGVEEGLYTATELRPLYDLLQSWRAGYFHFETMRTGGSRRATLASSDKLEPDGSNIHEVLVHLALNRRRVFEELSGLLNEIIPEVGILELSVSKTEVSVGFRQTFGAEPFLNVKDLGTGVEQLLLVLAAGVSQEARASTLVLEEPETGLHPAAQRSLMSYLSQLKAYDQVLISTHSPVFLDSDAIEQDLWLVTRSSSESRLERVEGLAKSVLEELGVRLSDVLVAEKLILVEGPTDVELLRVWFKEALLGTKLALTDGGGGDNANHADLLARWMDAADHFQRRDLVYLRDRDELPEDLVRRIEDSGRVRVLPRREIENYLLDPLAILKVLRSEFPGRALPGPSEVDRIIDEGAESCRTRVVIGRVSRRLSSIRFINHRDRARLANAGARKREVIDHVIDKLPRRTELRAQVAALWDEEASAVAA